MATTTTNYGFDIPQSTDLVKDGATAIATLGQDIDTAMNTALGTKKAGLVLLNTTSFSGVSSQSFNNVFSATYDNYMITVFGTASSATGVQMRMRVSGADNTASEYRNIQKAQSGSSTITGYYTLGNLWDAFNFATTNSGASLTMQRPFASDYTNLQINSSTLIVGENSNYVHRVASSFDGFTLISATGGVTLTGTVSVYGFNK